MSNLEIVATGDVLHIRNGNTPCRVVIDISEMMGNYIDGAYGRLMIINQKPKEKNNPDDYQLYLLYDFVKEGDKINFEAKRVRPAKIGRGLLKNNDPLISCRLIQKECGNASRLQGSFGSDLTFFLTCSRFQTNKISGIPTSILKEKM